MITRLAPARSALSEFPQALAVFVGETVVRLRDDHPGVVPVGDVLVDRAMQLHQAHRMGHIVDFEIEIGTVDRQRYVGLLEGLLDQGVVVCRVDALPPDARDAEEPASRPQPLEELPDTRHQIRAVPPVLDDRRELREAKVPWDDAEVLPEPRPDVRGAGRA